LYRSIRDKKITGLCGGIAEYFNIDPTMIRLVLAIAAVFSGGTVLIVYIIASIVIPKEPRYGDPYDPYYRPSSHQHHGPYGNSYGGGYGGKHYGPGPRPGQSGGPYRPGYEPNQASSSSNIDEMMKEVEKKAMQKEIEELKAKLAKLEKITKDQTKGDV
jgi:phage shock protein PspC (stress-responsive transcriptional regulator)